MSFTKQNLKNFEFKNEIYNLIIVQYTLYALEVGY